MLKVVGATWTSSRVFSLVIGGIIVVVLVLVIVWELDRYEEDGKYAATVFWSERIGYHIKFWGEGNDLGDLPKGVARAVFKPDNEENGWSQLEVQTQPSFDDSVQAYAAGYLEGCLSWQLIYQHWANTVQRACVGTQREEYCLRVRRFLRDNTDAVRARADEMEREDPYWHQVNLFYKQLDGIINGWQYGMFRAQSDRFANIPAEDFLWMNVASELADLEPIFGGTYEDTASPFAVSDAVGLSSAFVKLNAETGELFVAHNSAGLYSSMLKMLKRYELRYHRTASEDSEVVAGTSVTFSSYPGAVHSQDDFYHVTGEQSHVLVVTGSAMLGPRRVRSKVLATEQVLMGPRVVTANRLALDGKSWARLANQGHADTGNKQWLVVDPTRMDRVGQKGLLTLVEHLPERFHPSDRSHWLWRQGYFAVHGLPFHHTIPTESDALADSPISRILQRGHEDAVDVASIQQLMRSNDFASDPLSDGNPMAAIAARGDVPGVPNGVPNRAPRAPRPLGVTDVKVLRCPGDAGECQLRAIAGPTFHPKSDKPKSHRKRLAPFKWSSSIFSMLPHMGQPDEWNFGLVSPVWAWN